MSDGILPSLLGAVQASLAVLLTISYGVVASRLSILKEGSSRDISKICVRLFLPALLITNVGAELHADTAIRYVHVLSKSPNVDCEQTHNAFAISAFGQLLTFAYSLGIGLYTIIYDFGLGLEESL